MRLSASGTSGSSRSRTEIHAVRRIPHRGRAGAGDPVTIESQAAAFLATIEPAAHVEELVSFLPDVNYFAKDRFGRFMLMDEGFVSLLGCARRSEVLGKTDFDFFPRDIASKYVTDDARVMRTGRPLRNLTEPIPNADRTFSWWMVNKVPLRDRAGVSAGVAGLLSRLSLHNAPSHYGKSMFAVLEHIGRHYQEEITVNVLAAVAGMSERAFSRNFVLTFQMTPMRYVNRVRLQAARHALLNSNLPLAGIAEESGFYDQSHMTALFTRLYGVSPRRYRAARLGKVAVLS